jgi:endopeptidase La
MLPITIDRSALGSLPLPDAATRRRIQSVLAALANRRVLPYFSEVEGVDTVRLARVSERFEIVRLADAGGRNDVVSLLTFAEEMWTIHIHERVFDYLAFTLPSEAASDLSGDVEARKMLALAELLLRHEFDGMINPERPESQVLSGDRRFALHRRGKEEGFFAALSAALSDDSSGFHGETLLDLCRRDDGSDDDGTLLGKLIGLEAGALSELDDELIRRAMPTLGLDLVLALCDRCWMRAQDAALPVRRRAAFLTRVLTILDSARIRGDGRLGTLLQGFLQDGRMPALAAEAGLEITGDETPEDLTSRFEERLDDIFSEEPRGDDEGRSQPVERSLDSPTLMGEKPRRTLQERVEAARNNPLVPRAVLEAIDRNELNLAGQSKAKYTEFVDTLLSVPWGKVLPIHVGPREFTAGLDASHYGLERPKELVSDFFANLIWRYRDFDPQRPGDWRHSGSAFLFVGPPGVGKTSLAISIARNLGLPYHKVSLGGMRDDTDLRGHGFTYEGSRPGAIVQGLIRMGAMNGMFILDEVDKTESFAISTLLEILDPEQNHLFHDKYTQTTVDIDLSNSHFVLTANTLETVPAPIIDRCQVVRLDRYAVGEKVQIALRHIIPRLRDKHRLPEEAIALPEEEAAELVRFLVEHYTNEAGVRQLELVLRNLFLRVQRRDLLEAGRERVVITRELIKQRLDEPRRGPTINDSDRVGESLGIGVDVERSVGTTIAIQATPIGGPQGQGGPTLSMIHATGNIEKVMDESRKVATTGILYCADELGLDPGAVSQPVHLHFMGAATRKDGPSAGAAIAIALTSMLTGRPVRRDVAITGEIDTQGRISGVGGLDIKLETAINAGCRTLIMPRDNLHGPDGIEAFPHALREELQVLDIEDWRGDDTGFDAARQLIQVVAVGRVADAWRVAQVNEEELAGVADLFARHAAATAQRLAETGLSARPCPLMLSVKSDQELDADQFDSTVCCGCGRCVIVAAEEAQEGVRERVGDAKRVVVADHAPGALRRALELEVLRQTRDGECGTVGVVGPYFLLRDAVLPEGRVLRLANNFASNRKLKGLKPVLNRAWCRLLHLGPQALDEAPFVILRDGVYVFNLDLIPEKYRLDPARAEDLARRFLEEWLRVVESEVVATVRAV